MSAGALAVALDPVLAGLETALEDARAKGSIPLDEATLDPDKSGSGTPVAALIEAALGGAPTLTGAATVAQVEGQDALLVKGMASAPILGIAAPQVSATFTTVKNAKYASGLELQVAMEIACGSGWTLAKSFPQLGQTSLGEMTLDTKVAQAFVLRSADDLAGADAYGPVQRAGLNLELGVVMDGSGPFGLLGKILGGISGTLKMAGPVESSPSAESIGLRAPSGVPSVGFPVAGLAPIGLASSAVVVSGAAGTGVMGEAAGVALEVWALVSVGGSTVPLGIGIPIGVSAWRLFVVPGQGVRLFQMLEFIPGLGVLEQVPDQVQNVVNEEIETFSLTLAQGTSGGWSLQSLQVIVSSPQPWTIIPGVVEIEQAKVSLVVSWPGASVTGSVSGTIGLDPVDGHPAVEIAVNVPIPLGSAPIVIASSPAVQLPGLGALTTLVGGADLTASLPAGMDKVGSFMLESFFLSIDVSGPSPKLKEAAILLTADAWAVIPKRLELEAIVLELDLEIDSPTPLSGQIGGTVAIGTSGVRVLVEREPRSDWELSVSATGVPLPSLEDIAELAGTDLSSLMPPAIAEHRFEISTLELDADLSKGSMELFEIVVQSEGVWAIVPKQFEIEQLVAGLTLDWRSGTLIPSGGLRAVLDFGELVYLELEAKRPPDGGWVLRGELEHPVEVGKLIGRALGSEYASHVPSGITIERLSLTYETLPGSYAFAVAASWIPELEALKLEVDAALALERRPDPAKPGQFLYSGHIEGDMKSHFGSDQLDLAIAYDFQPEKNSFVFRLGFNALTLTATYTKLPSGDETIVARLAGVSFGELVEWLVNLVDPQLHFELSAPWDVLNKIHFEDFAIVGNLTQRTIGIEYDPSLDLGIVDVKSITLTYLHKGGSATIDVGIVGSFLGQSYPPAKPLTWDLLNEPPPATPGAGAALFDLQDLGVGQHLLLADPKAKTMSEVMQDVHEIIVNTSGKKPWEELEFDPDAGWLVAADFTVMGTVTLKLIFDDPAMYGVEIALAGEKAGPFAGLDFQILYRKVSDDVGVYHIELKLPDAMRHLEFGEVSIALPIVTLDIYTNGGFYLDFGFPYNNDWTVCFGLQVFPFVGSGGFYVGRLTAADGATGLVPAITNGTFGPVIEFGVALALGVGKTIDEGPLSAGVSVTVQGVLQGVVAWFNPTDPALPSDRYYKVNGSLAIMGQLYGEVNFKVISVSVSLVARVTASVQIESYAPIVLGLSVSVEVEASIKILFIRIHFSFSMHLDASFTIGSQQATPWQLASAGGAPSGQAQLFSPAAARRREGGHHLLAGPSALVATTVLGKPEKLSWDPVNVVGAKQVLTVTMLPVFTVAPDPKTGVDAVAIAMAPSLDAPPPDAPTATATSFDRLVQSLVKWGMQTLIGSHAGAVTAVDLRLIYEDLSSDWIAQGGFAYANFAAFLEANFAVAVAAPPPHVEEAPGAVLPMLPPLKMSPDGQPEVDFWSANQVDASWQQGVQELFARLAVNSDYNRAPDPLGGDDTPAGADTPGAGTEALAEALFGDWALIVARSALQAASDALSNASHTTTSGDSLIGLAWLLAAGTTVDGEPQPLLYLTRSGDTAAAVALLFGIPAEALSAANPGVDWGELAVGTKLTIPAPMALADYVSVPGDTLAGIAKAWRSDAASIEAANPAVDFDTLQGGTPVSIPAPAALFTIAAANLSAALAGGSLPIAGLSYRIRAGDTLQKIAEAYGQPAAAAGELAEANASAPGVLLAGAPEKLELAAASGTIPYTIATGDGLAAVAAVAFVRNLGQIPFGADQSWFASAIAQANPGIDFEGTLNPGLALTIPGATETPSGPSPTGTSSSYLARAGDTLELIAGCFAMTELHGADPSLATVEAEISKLNPSVDWTKVGTTVQLPAQQHAIVAGDTLGGLAARFGLEVAEVATRPANLTASILTPNVTIALPAGLAYPVAAGTKLADLAGTVGLSVDELVGRIGAIPGALAAGASLALPNRRQIDVEELVEGLAGAPAANVSGMASHFTLHGLRVPVPPDPENPIDAALYALSGQQLPAPAQPLTGEYNIVFAVGDGSDWIYPVAPYTTTGSDTLHSLEQTYGSAVAPLNPGVEWSKLEQGTVLRVPQADVTVQIDQTTLAAESPLTTLKLDGAEATVVALVGEQPVRHVVAAPVPWTAATPPTPPLTPGTPSPPPRPSGGGLSLWRLPASLASSIATDPSRHPYGLMSSPRGQPVGDDPPQASYYAWATWIPLKIQRVAAPDGGWLEGTYLVLGADQVDRETLFELWTALGTGEGVQLSLAYAAAAAGAGLVSDAIDPAATAVLKTNLSTETHSGAELADARAGRASSSDAYAELAAPTQFLQLLWEASVTGSGGYYLTYAKTGGGGGLPSSVWASGDEASLYVIALLDPALAPAPDRNLYPFTTGAVVADNLDPSRLDVFAQATDGSDVAAVASAPPGNVAFGLTRPNASPAVSPSAEERTQSLFSLLAYSIAGAGFNPSPLALPVGPTGSGAVWSYDQTVPVYRLSQHTPANMAPGLPGGAEDPYAGIAAGASVDVSLGFRDVFGNEIDTAIAGLSGVAVGYYDAVRGLAAWPSASAAYAIAGSAQAPTLELRLDLGLDKYVPSTANPFPAAVQAAAAHQAIYGQVHYQVQQPDVSFSVATSLDPPGAPHLTGAALAAPLRSFVMGSYLYLGTAQSVQQLEHLVATGGEQLQEVAATYTLTAAQLLAANSAVDASQLVEGDLTAPLVHCFAANDTLAAIAAAAGLGSASALLALNADVELAAGVALATAAWTYTTIPQSTLASIATLEDTTPVAVAVANTEIAGILDTRQSVACNGKTQPIGPQDTLGTLAADLGATVAELAAQNQAAPLFLPDVAVFVAGAAVPPGESGGARSYTTVAGDTLGSIARDRHCTVAGLGLANGQLAVLDKTRSVEVNGTTVPIRDGTFATVVADLLAKDTAASIADVAAAIADPPQATDNVLLAGVALAIPDYVVQPGDTLASVLETYGSVFTEEQIGLLNGPLQTGIYPAGAALATGALQLTPVPGETFAGVAASRQLTIGQLAAANAGAKLRAGQPVAIPAATSLGATQQAAYQVPFDASPAPKPIDVATAFDTAPATLGSLNATMPGLVAGGIEVTYPPTGQRTTTQAGDTLAGVAQRVGAANASALLADPAVSTLAGLIAPGALLQCPLPGVGSRSLNGLAEAIGVDATDLANANSALVGLIAPNQTLVVEHVDQVTHKISSATIQTAAQDTLGSLVRKLQHQVAAMSLGDLLSACGNSTTLLTGASAIVPPARVAIASPFAGARVEAPFTPLEATVTIARDPALVDEAAMQNGLTDAIGATSALAPDLDDYGGLRGFAESFETALAAQRLKLAIGPSPEGGQQRMWVVDFGADGFQQIEIEGAKPRFYALAPIGRELAGGPASIELYEPATGTLAKEAVTQSFSSIDLDAWMRTALEAIDLFLSPAVAASAFQLEPAGLAGVVDSKGTIAAALRDRVAEILVDRDPDPEGLAAAQEALYQSMLVALGTAYTTDAIVQLPLAIQSPYGPTYTTGPSDTFATVAAAYGLSPEAAQAQFASVAPSGTFPAQTTLDQSAMLCTTGTSDTFATLAAFFATDPGSVGIAALDVAGLIPAGTPVGPYVVKQGDDLRTIAQQSGIAATAVAVELAQAGTLLSPAAEVRCFSALNPIAPRLSGKPLVERYRAAAGNTSQQLIEWFRVSAAALGEAVANMQGILCTGAVVTNTANDRRHTIAAGDSFRSLLGPLGAADVGTLLPTLAVTQGGGLLSPGVAPALGRVSHLPSQSDSFTTIAAFFDEDPAGVAIANEGVGSAFAPGAVLTLSSGASYTVKGPESIGQVATALDTSPPLFATDPAIVQRIGIFNTQSALHGLQSLPDFSLSTAKTPLIQGTQFVSFLFATSADTRLQALFLNLDYDISELEFEIADVAAAPGYQSSDWLRFGVPLDAPPLQPDVRLEAGQVEVPIALRSYPQLPLMQSLDACATWSPPLHPPTTIAEAKQWHMSASVQHQSAAQDEMLLEATFNAGAPTMGIQAVSPTLFAKLAQLVTAWPAMQHDVAALGAMTPGAAADGGRLANMVSSFATLVSELATALAGGDLATEAIPSNGETQTYTFLLDTTSDISRTYLETVELVLQQGSSAGAVPWPAIWVTGGDGRTHRLTADPVVAGAESRRYYYPQDTVEAFATLTHRFAMPGSAVPPDRSTAPAGRDALAWQSGQASVAVRRNADLVSTDPTATEFIYQTPWISFTNPAVPLLQTSATIPLSAGASFQDRLAAGLTELLTSDGSVLGGTYNVRLLCRCALELAAPSGNGSGAAIVELLPVFYVPLWGLTAGDDLTGFAATGAARVKSWLEAQQLTPTVADSYVLDLSLFASGDSAMVRPLVELSGLTIAAA